MSAGQLKNSIRDVLPECGDDIPEYLMSFTEYLYQLSLRKMPLLSNKAEIGRHHFCAYLAAEKYKSKLSLGEISTNKIPVPPRLVAKSLDDFRVSLLNQERVSTPSPRTTPRKRKVPELKHPSSPLTPTKSNHATSSPAKASPLKRLHEIAGQESSPFLSENDSLKDSDSPFNTKSETKEVTPSSPHKYIRRHITIPELISFANNFYIPAPITLLLIGSFVWQKRKFVKKNEWLLACGIIYTAYVRINHSLLSKHVSAKNQFLTQLFHYQKGGLVKSNMILWCYKLELSIKDEQWVLDLEEKYMYGVAPPTEVELVDESNALLGEDSRTRELLGMIPLSYVDYTSASQTSYYDNWSSNVLQVLK